MPLSVIALNCTLKRGDEASSTDKLIRETLAEFKKLNVDGEAVRVVNLNIKPGVTSDEGGGDEWPALRRQILAADIRASDMAWPAFQRGKKSVGADGCIFKRNGRLEPHAVIRESGGRRGRRQ
jgi:hypothetical protein